MPGLSHARSGSTYGPLQTLLALSARERFRLDYHGSVIEIHALTDDLPPDELRGLRLSVVSPGAAEVYLVTARTRRSLPFVVIADPDRTPFLEIL